MGVFEKWDQRNKRTPNKHNSQDKPTITPAAKVILSITLGGSLLLIIVISIAIIVRGSS
jgi:hypothetical protein